MIDEEQARITVVSSSHIFFNSSELFESRCKKFLCINYVESHLTLSQLMTTRFTELLETRKVDICFEIDLTSCVKLHALNKMLFSQFIVVCNVFGILVLYNTYVIDMQLGLFRDVSQSLLCISGQLKPIFRLSTFISCTGVIYISELS